ncbi:hypothetical protein M9458_025066, partial [Cirrhinus mrigala]
FNKCPVHPCSFGYTNPSNPVVPKDMPESPSQEPSGRVPYSVPVSEHMEECVMNEDNSCLETLLEGIPKGAE